MQLRIERRGQVVPKRIGRIEQAIRELRDKVGSFLNQKLLCQNFSKHLLSFAS